MKTKILLWTLFITCFFLNSAQINAQKAELKEFGDVQILSATFENEKLVGDCLSDTENCFKDIKVSLYQTEDKVNTVLTRASDNSHLIGVTVKEPCKEDSNDPNKTLFPEMPDEMCFDIKSKELKILYRFGKQADIEDDKYTIIVQLTLPNQTPELYTATAKTELFPFAKQSTAEFDRDFTLDVGENVYLFYTTDGQKSKYEIDHNDRIIRVQIELISRLTDVLDEESDKLTRDRKLLGRVRNILSWVHSLRANPQNIAGLKTELVEKPGTVTPFEVYGFSYLVKTPARNCEIPSELNDLTKEEQYIFCVGRFTLFLLTKKKFPNVSFHLKYEFEAAAPYEFKVLSKLNKVVLVPGVEKPIKIESNEVDQTLGLRSFESNLDTQFSLSGSVKDVTEDEITFRKREYQGTLDIRFAPFLNRNLHYYSNGSSFNWTPFFLDAKISSGSIDKDTLSTNRIYLGTEFSFLLKGKKKDATGTTLVDRNKYKLSFRFINASDRDFKRVEGKFNFETLFYLTSLNKPLSKRFLQGQNSTLNTEAQTVFTPTGNFGYQIQPIVGFDIGRTYRNKRDPFENEEQSTFVRRVYFGLDMQFDLTRRFQIKIKDTLYLRGGTSGSIDINHFKGTLETPIGTLGRGAVQSAFFSYEQGYEPPFAGRGVNAFKVGYRINFNFGLDGVVY